MKIVSTRVSSQPRTGHAATSDLQMNTHGRSAAIASTSNREMWFATTRAGPGASSLAGMTG